MKKKSVVNSDSLFYWFRSNDNFRFFFFIVKGTCFIIIIIIINEYLARFTFDEIYTERIYIYI